MEKRLKIGLLEPKFYEILSAIDAYIATLGLTPTQLDLIKIRASQMNGCAYCIQSHTKEARAHGETEKRIYALDAWEESPYFSEEERALLALTEEVTLVSKNRVPKEVYDRVIALFGERTTAHFLMAIISINSWNRIGISTRMTPA